MKSVLAFAGSNASGSINHKLVTYAASKLEDIDVEILKMSEMEFPIYSQDLEKTSGFPEELVNLHTRIRKADALMISLNEHNSNFSAYFKNIIDWLSRLDRAFLEEKKLFLLATSPGGRGAWSSLKIAKHILPRFGGEIVNMFSLPSFQKNFSSKHHTIRDVELNAELEAKIALFVKMLHSLP